MTEILTVTANPAIDLATVVDRVIPGPKLRCGPARVDPGGGGINVARAIARFGGNPKAIFAVGGETGQQLIAMVKADGVTPIPVTVTGHTRKNLAVTDAQTGEQYRFSLTSDRWTGQDERAFMQTIGQAATKDCFVVLSGGIAPGMSEAFHGQVQKELGGITDKIIVDTCDPALSRLIAQPAMPFYILRLDQHEAAMAAGRDLGSLRDSFEFGAELIGRGVAEIVVIGRGATGSLLMSRDQRLFCHAVKVPVLSKIGAGDAFVGGLTFSLLRGDPLDHALRWAVAAASATVRTEGTALCTLEDVTSLLPQCWIETVNP